MAQFAYKARRRTGEVVKGVLDVPDRAAALVQIERLGLFPVLVDASKAGAAPVTEAAPERATRKGIIPTSLREAMRRKDRKSTRLNSSHG